MSGGVFFFFDLFACILGSHQAQCGARPRMLGAKKVWCQFSTPDTAYPQYLIDLIFTTRRRKESLLILQGKLVVEHGMVRCIAVRLPTFCIYNSLWFFYSLRPTLVYSYSTLDMYFFPGRSGRGSAAARNVSSATWQKSRTRCFPYMQSFIAIDWWQGIFLRFLGNSRAYVVA